MCPHCYRGPPFFGDNKKRLGWFTITSESTGGQTTSSRSQSDYESNSRRMIAVRGLVCYAWTICKAQGQTI